MAHDHRGAIIGPLASSSNIGPREPHSPVHTLAHTPLTCTHAHTLTRARLERHVHKLERDLDAEEGRGVGGERTRHGGAKARPQGSDAVLGDELARTVEEAAVRPVRG